MPSYVLSKSTFLKGQQCLKALYLNKFHKDLAAEISETQQAIFDRGHAIGALAQDYYSGGMDCTPIKPFDYDGSSRITKEAIENDAQVLYEATFIHNGVMAAVDLMQKVGDSWNVIEVKSSSSVKEVHIWDAAIQYYILNAQGIQIKDMLIMFIDTSYVKEGEIELESFFKLESVLKKVKKHQHDIEDRVMRMKETLAIKRLPNMSIGPHCNSPYTCNFKEYCWQDIPAQSVFNLNRMGQKAFDLYDQGIVELKDIPGDYKLSHFQSVQRSSFLNSEVHIENDQIKDWIEDLEYPLFYFDFESIGPAIPVWEGSRPYQGVVFQYSLHIQREEGGELEHKELLVEPDGSDPRELIIENMIKDLESSGSIIVYNESFERSKINEMCKDGYVSREVADAWIDRIADLEDPFKKSWYYDPAMNGKSSIKNVLPALVPELSYDNLDIQNGNMANASYEQYLNKREHLPSELRQSLLEYCKLDTYAMVRILTVLLEKVQ